MLTEWGLSHRQGELTLACPSNTVLMGKRPSSSPQPLAAPHLPCLYDVLIPRPSQRQHIAQTCACAVSTLHDALKPTLWWRLHLPVTGIRAVSSARLVVLSLGGLGVAGWGTCNLES